MCLPSRIQEVLIAWGVQPDVRARLSELFLFLGQPAIDAFIDVAETCGRPPSELVPDDLLLVRAQAGERYLRQNHGRWLAGEPTPGFWRDRTIEGGPAGLVTPLGDLGEPRDDFSRAVAEASERCRPQRRCLHLEAHARQILHPQMDRWMTRMSRQGRMRRAGWR